MEDVIGYSNTEGQDDDYEGQFNDDEFLEMLDMQEECQREMMKTYVQANNPTMFEEIYYNVAYPDEPVIPIAQQPVIMNHQSHEEPQNAINGIGKINLNDDSNVIDLVKTNLNPQANEFIPKKFSDAKQ